MPRGAHPISIALAMLLVSVVATRRSHAETAPAATVVLDTPGAPVEPATLLDIARPAIRVFRDRDGLPENAIMSIARDTRGDLVVGTQDGVATFDGHAWTTLDLPNREVSNFVRGVHVDEAGGLWCGRQDGGVARFDGSSWASYDVASGLPSGRVNAVTTALAGDGSSRRAVWVATEHGVARRDAAGWVVFGDDAGLPNVRADTLLEATGSDGATTLYAGTSQGLFELHGGRFEPVAGAPRTTVQAILETRAADLSPILWVGGAAGLARREHAVWRTNDEHSGLPGRSVAALAQTIAADGSPTLWVATGDGVVRLHDGRWVPFPTEGILPSPDVGSLLAEPAAGPTQMLWIGADGGLARVRFGGWQSFDLPARSSSVFATIITHDDAGHDVLWVGTRGDGLFRFAAGVWTHFGEEDGLAEATIFSLGEVAEKGGGRSLWIGTIRGLQRFERGTFSPTLFPSAAIRAMTSFRADDGSEELYAATGDVGVVHYVDGAWHLFDEAATRKAFDVRALRAPDGGVELWVATEREGILRRKAGVWTRFDRATGALANDSVETLHVHRAEDGHRTLWAGTEGGGVSVLDLDTPNARFVTYNDSSVPPLPTTRSTKCAKTRGGASTSSRTRGSPD